MPRSEIQNERRKARRRATRAPLREAAAQARARRLQPPRPMPEVVVIRRAKRPVPA